MKQAVHPLGRFRVDWLRRTRSDDPAARLRVMMSFKRRTNRGGNPYIDQLAASLAATTDVFDFSWPRALVGRFDVLHVHWPEQIMRSRYPLVGLIKAWLVVALLGTAWRRAAIVRTVHNTAPHESGSAIEALSLRLLDRETDWFVTLNNSLQSFDSDRSSTILHGDYRDWFNPILDGLAPVAGKPGRVLFFGSIRPYKGLERLIALFDTHESGSDIDLRIVGQGTDRAYVESVRSAIADRRNITANFAFLSEPDLAVEILRSEVVILPYANFENSGALLLSLSLGRPAIVPNTPITRDLQAEFGSSWVLTFDDLTLDVVSRHVSLAREAALKGSPDLSLRGWDESAALHVAAYRKAIAHNVSRHGYR